MNLLCLDTTSRDASIAVLRDEETLLEYNFNVRGDLSAMLIPGLDFLMRSLDLNIAQVDLFGVAVGPGLFTGIRIGLATVKGLNLDAGKPVVGVNTLEAMACKFAAAEKNVVSLIDARKGEVYLGCYGLDNGGMRERIAPCLLPVPALPSVLGPIADKVFVGSGAACHGDFLRRSFPGDPILQRSNFLASEIGRITRQRFRSGQAVTDVEKLLPFYMRMPDAESNLHKSDGAVD